MQVLTVPQELKGREVLVLRVSDDMEVVCVFRTIHRSRLHLRCQNINVYH